MSTEAPPAPAAEPAATPAAAPDQNAAAATPAAPPAAPAFLGGAPPPAADPPSSSARPNTFFGEHVQREGVFQEGWTEGLQQAGFERLATKAALAKDEATLLRSLDEALGLVGRKSVGSYPQEGASDAELSAFRHAAGVPDSPEGYALKPEKLPDGVQWDEQAMGGYAEIFHRHHVPKAAAQELLARHLEQVGAQAAQQTQASQQQITQMVQQSEATFQKEWGVNYESRLEQNRAFVASRFEAGELADPALQAALSHPKIVRLVDEARRSLRESGLPGQGAEAAGNTHSPRQQAQELMRANPGWEKNPDLSGKINQLYALDAAQAKRKR